MNVKSLALTGAFVALLGGVVAQERLSDGTVNGSSAINQNAILELASRNKGILHTRVALEMTTKANPMQAHVAGLMVYNTEAKNDVVPGIYYNDGTKWVLASGGKATSISYNPETYEISFIDINGNPVKLDFRKIVQSNQTITTLVDNKNGTYVYTSESGVQTIINVTADVTNTFEQIISNEKVKNEFVSLIKNIGGNVYYKDGKFTFLTKEGEVKEILLEELVRANETLTVLDYLSGSNQLKYQDEKGTSHVLDLGTGSLGYNENTNVLTYVDAKGMATDITLNKTDLVYNADNKTLNYTNSNGIVQTVMLGDIVRANETLTVLDYLSGSNQLAYQDEKGASHVLDLGTGSLTYNEETNVLTYVDEKGKGTDLVLNRTNLEYNADNKTLNYTNSNGIVQTVMLGDIVRANETLTVLDYLSGSNQLKYQDEKGTSHTFDLGTGSLAYNEETNVLTYVDEKGKGTDLILNRTNLEYNADNKTLNYTNSNGVFQTVALDDIVRKNETLTVLDYLSGSNQLKYQDEKGTSHTFDLGTGSLAYNEETNVLTYVDEKGKGTDLILNRTNLEYNADNKTLNYTNSNGVFQTVALDDIVRKNETLTVLDYLPGSNQLTYQDEKGTPHTFDLGTGSLGYNEKTNVLTYIDAKKNATNLTLNRTNLEYSPDKKTLNYTNSNGIVQAVTLDDIVRKNETLTVLDYLSGSNQLKYQDEKGTPHVLDLGIGSITYNEKTNTLTYVDAKKNATDLSLNKTNLEYDPEENQLKYMNTSGHLQSVSLPNETVTTLKQDALGLKYKNEKDTEVTAKIVSANEKNIIKVDEDFGALLTAQEIQFNQEKAIVSAGTGVKVDTKVKGNEVEYTVSIDEDIIKELKAAMPKFFYMPSIVMPTSKDQITDPSIITENGGVFTVRLYDSYKKQFSLSDPSSSVSSLDATTTLPILAVTELDYYVTFYDKTVFTEVKLLQGGILTYKIASDADVTLGSFMNVVFAVKP